MLRDTTFNLVMEDTLKSSANLHGCIITIDDKLWIEPTYTRYIFPNRDIAYKTFYNCMKYKVRWRAYLYSNENTHRTDPHYRYYNTPDTSYVITPEELAECRNWRAFKKDLFENHSFKIIDV